MTRKRKHNQKRKPTNHDKKVMAALYKKDYMANVRILFDMLTDEDTYGMLPAKEVDILYQLHFTPPRFEMAPGTRLNKKLLNSFKETLHHILNSQKVTIMNGKHEITLLEYLTYYFTIFNYSVVLKDKSFAGASSVREKLIKNLQGDEELTDKITKELESVIRLLGLLHSNPVSGYYWLKVEKNVCVREHKGSCFLMVIYSGKPHINHFTIHGEKRPGYRVGIPVPLEGIKWVPVVPQDSKLFNWNDITEVYIQSHSMNRLFERLEVMQEPSINLHFFISMMRPKPITFNNKILIPLVLLKCTVGYFIASVIDRKILLRTFLFITNEGTPEAKKFQEMVGLSKLDIKYLNIDKLRKFIESDISSHETVKNIFIEAGCECLFNLQFDQPYPYTRGLQLAEDIMKHIGLKEA